MAADQARDGRAPLKYTPAHVAAAEARAGEARARLLGTLGEIQQRLRPSTLAQDAVESAAAGVATVARKGADAVRKRPVALAAVAGGIGLVMARGWIADIFRRGDATQSRPDSLRPKRVRRAKGPSTCPPAKPPIR
ncbi:hypothetical protein OF829_18485 [Sphingomonas sp. LB-2]|uniref:hypothetical protein n=1 Tax=Sphingomonas caeni TaxID=2984949 RepID=UPI0022314498|nr:hypothetical protein [Sphingomonas caeni]MCW3849230.1 hypothetical protein [Sphingomonas caeni]